MLTIVATPIGNLEDISLRALRVLREAEVILAEDTRHTGLLLKHFEIPHKPMVSLYDEVEAQRVPDLLVLVASQEVVLVSDAGTPLISDPGYKLVREAVSQGVKVDFVPGPSSVTAALVLSGLPPDKFTFWGFREPKESAPGTNIYFVSPHRLLKFLKALKQDQEIVICRELTKIHQEVWRGTVGDAMIKFVKPQGEIVVLWHN
ncbi:16S rRNA (cytidine(1402)-2'-O)-methyltransferase [Candidatus Microgenomates bacterium]|nr:16S rRNA (cytidine(1402)-2'-O)-methyltransferase [Candidatus Microgenomates bacterium]